MKFGRRSKRNVSKTPILGQLLSGLNRRDRRALAKKGGAIQSPAKPRRPVFGLEPVEPRLLMSVDLSYPTVNDTVTLTATGPANAPIINLTSPGGVNISAPLTA